MSFKGKLVGFLLILTTSGVIAQTQLTQTVDEDQAQIQQFTYVDAFVLGVLEGITEYLPVSSTGHLILANRFLQLETGEDEAASLQFSKAINAYAIVIQGGAILAVIFLYWQRLLDIFMGALGRNPKGLRLLINLIVAFLPAAVLGLLLDSLIESFLFGPIPVIIALVAGAMLILAVEAWRRRKQRRENKAGTQSSKEPELHQLKLKQCFFIGLLQCVAMWPGTSRSMMTIVGGYLVGLPPKLAAEFSFLLGLITLSAASTYKGFTHGHTILETLSLGPVLFGIIISTIAATLAVQWLVGFLNKHGLAPFAWYRIGLAIVTGLALLI